jgi:hypothetical protein
MSSAIFGESLDLGADPYPFKTEEKIRDGGGVFARLR